MDKKDLFSFSIIPIILLCISSYAVYEIDSIFNEQYYKNASQFKELDAESFSVKIESGTDDESHNKLVSFIESTKIIVAHVGEIESTYVELIKFVFNMSVIFSFLWVVFVLCYYKKYRQHNV